MYTKNNYLIIVNNYKQENIERLQNISKFAFFTNNLFFSPIKLTVF